MLRCQEDFATGNLENFGSLQRKGVPSASIVQSENQKKVPPDVETINQQEQVSRASYIWARNFSLSHSPHTSPK
jgi:hypothetical protein